ncbi:alpha-L-rhamnosidase C-terminal domain-containing protein [Actinoplanes philippinensis]|uniref:alpha-L-rhamnosidase C-terminal domain-containing protein n=1 Tax=Actinoplanes philippinensis TaxID=35752 RepID=UPI003F4CBD13
MTRAYAEQETVRGRVACGWSREDDRLTVTATVPPGSTAVLYLPTSTEPVRLVSGRHTFTV